MRETIKFRVKDIGDFKLYVEPTMLDIQEIENIAAEIAGGGLQLAEYKGHIAEFQTFVKTQNDKDTADIGTTLNLAIFLQVKERLETIYKLATLIVLSEETPVDYRNIPESQFQSIYSAYEVALAHFRKEARQPVHEDAGVSI